MPDGSAQRDGHVRDVAVVGAGIVGLCTAEAVRRRGADVAIYERALPGAEQSAGSSRIFRHLHDDPRLVALAARGRAAWIALGKRLGSRLLAPDGEVTLGAGAEDLARLRGAGLAARPLDADELAQRLPLLAAFDGPALLDVDGGTIDSDTAIALLVARLRDSLVPAEVHGILPRAGGVRVESDAGATHHDRVVVCAGRGTARLARSVGLDLPVRLGRQLRLSFAVPDGEGRQLACLQDTSGRFGETSAYGVPQDEGRCYAVGLTDGIATRPDGSLVDPEGPVAMEERIIRYVRTALPHLDPTPVGRRLCWTTEVAWSSSGVAVWERDGVHLLAGHHLFKHAPALGEALAAAAMGEGLDDDLGASSRLGG